jgi:hypothetical protein
MSVHFPYITADYDDKGLILSSSFTIQFDGNDDSSLFFSSEEVSSFINSNIFENPGMFSMLIAGEDLNDFNSEYLYPFNVSSDLSSPSFSNYTEVAGGSEFAVGRLINNYNNVMTVDYSGDESLLSEQYNKYDSNSQYTNFSKALEGITNSLINEVYDLINKDEPVVLFKKTTQKPINLNSLAVLTSSATPSTQTTTTTSTTTTTTTTAGGSSYSGGGPSGGGGGY